MRTSFGKQGLQLTAHRFMAHANVLSGAFKIVTFQQHRCKTRFRACQAINEAKLKCVRNSIVGKITQHK
jgi:hypothetical protein